MAEEKGLRLTKENLAGCGAFVVFFKGVEEWFSRINKYAQSYVLDGKELHSPSIPFSSVVSGGKLEIGMGMAPKDNY